MSAPPDPHVPDLLLLAAAKLGWRLQRATVDLTVGTLTDDAGNAHHLLLASAGPGVVGWTLAAELPRGLPAYLMNEQTAAALRGGTPTGDGGIAYQGQRFRVVALYLNGNHVAEAHPVAIAPALAA